VKNGVCRFLIDTILEEMAIIIKIWEKFLNSSAITKCYNSYYDTNLPLIEFPSLLILKLCKNLLS